MDEDIKNFLTFWAKHGQEPLTVTSGVMVAPGCNGSGCCSSHCDLGGLADALTELTA